MRQYLAFPKRLTVQNGDNMQFRLEDAFWTRKPDRFDISDDKVQIWTEPHTDLWQRTYYHFRNDSAPVLQIVTEEQFFSFTVKTSFDSSHRFDQCGVAVYIDSNNWLKAATEYENESYQRLGSVVTNHGYSDWATTDISADIHELWYRLSRREQDFYIESSVDGVQFEQMRMCHLWEATGAVPFGMYAASPEDSSFCAIFSAMELGPCMWQPHDGQAPDEE